MARAINVNAGTNLAVKEEKKATIGDLIYSFKDKFASALPEVMTPERFARISANAVAGNPQLARCTQTSLVGALLASASCGLEPNSALGQAYIIPYGDKAQFQISYKGLIELAHRSGQLKDISAHIVYENDEFEYELGLEPKLRHVPAMKDRGGIIGAYAVCHLVSGGYGFEFMSVEDINKHRDKYSKVRSKDSPWINSWEEMAKKTCVKKVLKYMPVSSEYARATAQDGHVAEVDFKADFLEPKVEFDEDDIIDADYDVDDGKEYGGELFEKEEDQLTLR